MIVAMAIFRFVLQISLVCKMQVDLTHVLKRQIESLQLLSYRTAVAARPANKISAAPATTSFYFWRN
jgi:hypothetical protein